MIIESELRVGPQNKGFGVLRDVFSAEARQKRAVNQTITKSMNDANDLLSSLNMESIQSTHHFFSTSAAQQDVIMLYTASYLVGFNNKLSSKVRSLASHQLNSQAAEIVKVLQSKPNITYLEAIAQRHKTDKNSARLHIEPSINPNHSVGNTDNLLMQNVAKKLAEAKRDKGHDINLLHLALAQIAQDYAHLMS